MRSLLIGAALVALASPAAFADPGRGKGGGDKRAASGPAGGGNGGGSPGKAAKADGPGKAMQGRSGNDARPMQLAQGRPDNPGKGSDNKGAENNGSDRGPDKARGDKANGPAMRSPVDAPGKSAGKSAEKGRDFSADRKDGARPGEPRRIIARDDRDGPFRWTSERTRGGLIDGCPPGLAKKNNGCMPPGLARQDPWRPVYDRPDWWGYRDWGSGNYGYYDGYLLRYDGNRIASYVPLLGGALALGSAWPGYYEPVALPSYYQDFYGLGPSYRYADDVIYRLDPQTDAISAIAALLTGNDIAIGQPLPVGYDVYNVPYDYRDRYVDGPDAMYRYSDGYVYEVDPTTRLVQAAIELLI